MVFGSYPLFVLSCWLTLWFCFNSIPLLLSVVHYSGRIYGPYKIHETDVIKYMRYTNDLLLMILDTIPYSVCVYVNVYRIYLR